MCSSRPSVETGIISAEPIKLAPLYSSITPCICKTDLELTLEVTSPFFFVKEELITKETSSSSPKAFVCVTGIKFPSLSIANKVVETSAKDNSFPNASRTESFLLSKIKPRSVELKKDIVSSSVCVILFSTTSP